MAFYIYYPESLESIRMDLYCKTQHSDYQATFDSYNERAGSQYYVDVIALPHGTDPVQGVVNTIKRYWYDPATAGNGVNYPQLSDSILISGRIPGTTTNLRYKAIAANSSPNAPYPWNVTNPGGADTWNTTTETQYNLDYDLYFLRSTVDIYYNGDKEYSVEGVDEKFFTKDTDTYTMFVGVRANTDSDLSDFVYSTKPYNIRIRWTSPVSGHSFSVMLSNLQNHISHVQTATPLAYNFSYTTEIGSVAHGLRTPIGHYQMPPIPFADKTDVASVNSITLTQLLNFAQTQQAGVTEQDLFTEIFADFIDTTETQPTKTLSNDYSSLFGHDIDIAGSTITDPNADPSITDDNVYSDSIELTVPTLTATGVFNRCYVLDGNSVNNLCDYLYNANDSLFDEIIDGVLTRGNPIESLIDLRLYPFDVSSFTGAGTAESIKFGRTDTGVIGIKLPHNANAVIDLGHCSVPRYYNNFIDYQTTAELYVPFCGVVDLPIDRILNHTLSIKLIVDYITGACTAVVFVDSIPLIYQQGIIGVSIPMTATDSAAFGQTIAGNLISGASAMLAQNPAAMAKEAIDTASNLWEGSRLMRIGASSPQTSLFQPINAYLLLSVASPAEGAYSDEYSQNVGYACFMPVSQIGYMTGSGLTVFDNVKLTISQATAEEKEMILNALRNGVYM